MGYGPADCRYGNVSHLVKGSHGTGPSFEVATDDLIHDAHLIERAVTSILLGQRVEQIPREFDNSLSRYIVWLIKQTLLSVPRNSR